MRALSIPARSRTTFHGSFRLVMRLPGFCPGITQGEPGTRGNSSSTFTATGDSGTTRGPVLLSGSLSSRASRSTSFRCRHSISLAIVLGPPTQRPHPLALKPATESAEKPDARAKALPNGLCRNLFQSWLRDEGDRAGLGWLWGYERTCLGGHMKSAGGLAEHGFRACRAVSRCRSPARPGARCRTVTSAGSCSVGDQDGVGGILGTGAWWRLASGR